MPAQRRTGKRQQATTVSALLCKAALCLCAPSASAQDWWRDAVFWEVDCRAFLGGEALARLGLDPESCQLATIRTARHKLVHFTGLPPLLFDLAEDPGELIDRSGDPAMQGTRLELMDRLLGWRARHLDRRLTSIMLTPDGIVDERGASAR